MARTTILQDGTVGYRTKLMEPAQARRFAKCLEANSRFRMVDVVVSDRAKSDKNTFVTFHPSSDVRQADIYMGQWEQRQARASAEGGDYIFVQDRWKTWCYNPISQETYEIDSCGCTCPDFQFRCRKAALHCKHMIALSDRRKFAIAA